MSVKSASLVVFSLSVLLIPACTSNPVAPTPDFNGCELTSNDPQQPITGCWVGTFDSIEEPGSVEDPGCGGIGVAASAKLEQKGSTVTGPMSAPQSCGFTGLTFEGTLDAAGTLSGTLKRGQLRGTAVGTLIGGQLELSTSDVMVSPPELAPQIGVIAPAGTLHLHR